jgi:hypothetical protein
MVAYLYVRHFSILWARVLLASGLWMILTAAFRWCPVSWLLGITSIKPLAERPAQSLPGEELL